jgi:hypothetical protein
MDFHSTAPGVREVITCNRLDTQRLTAVVWHKTKSSNSDAEVIRRPAEVPTRAECSREYRNRDSARQPQETRDAQPMCMLYPVNRLRLARIGKRFEKDVLSVRTEGMTEPKELQADYVRGD